MLFSVIGLRMVQGGYSYMAYSKFRDKNSIPQALAFDVFGTVAEWRTSIIREGQLISARKGMNVDWAAFADAWRAGYEPAMHRVRIAELPWTNIDGLHRMILDELLVQFQINGLSSDEVNDLNKVWHRLLPWPDVIAGLNRMRSRYLVASLSNGNVSLLVNMARNAGLIWDCVLSSELAGHYKPDPEVYQTAASLLGLPPEEVMMVAAHKHDLNGAKQVGFQTAYVDRPLEYGPKGSPDLNTDPVYDIVARDFVDLALQLGV